MNRYRQLHLWITAHDYSLLKGLADERKETMSCVIRRLIKLHQVGPGFDPEEMPEARAVCQTPPL